MPKEKILITVKTYPTLSRKHGELVCTAGLRENGTWMRIYPVPYRLLDYEHRYSKFDWIETSFSKNTSDPRPESFRPNDPHSIQKVGEMDTHDDWRERRDIVLGKAQVYDRLGCLIKAAHANELSLAVFKPTTVLDFVWEADEEKDWDPAKVEEMRSKGDQGELFATEHWRETLELIPKSYRERSAIKERTKLGLLRARANGRIGGGRYKLSATQQAEAVKMIRLGEKSQAEIAELFNVDRSSISRMMKEAREKELLKAAR